MKDCQYFEPTTLEEALKLMETLGRAVIPIAGGTDLLLDVFQGRRGPAHLLNLNSIASLNFIEKNGALRIGATTTLHSIHRSPAVRAHCEMLVDAAARFGSRQIRNVATLGGNVCNAQPYADSLPSLVAADAKIIVVGSKGRQSLSVADFIKAPRQTVLQEDELVTELVIPQRPPRTGSAYLVHTTRKALDLAVAGVAVSLTLDAHDRVQEVRIAVGNCSPRPVRALEAEQLLVGNELSDELVAEVARQAALAAKEPYTALPVSEEYWRELVRVLTQRVVRQAARRARAVDEEVR